MIGQWKNFDELELNLSLPELEFILDAHREQQQNQNRFLAALKGIDLDAGAAQSAQDRFDDIVAEVYAEAEGVSEDEYTLGSLGWGVEDEDEYEEVGDNGIVWKHEEE